MTEFEKLCKFVRVGCMAYIIFVLLTVSLAVICMLL